MNILDHIPFGKENAISREALADLYGGGSMGDRRARKAVEIARRTQVILNLQDGSGYFRPLPHEGSLVEKQYNQTASRANNINRQRRALRKWQRDHSGQQSLEV